jgi:hypothetical protein
VALPRAGSIRAMFHDDAVMDQSVVVPSFADRVAMAQQAL